jgi:hypothetical protein
MIAAHFLPLLAPALVDPSQVLIPLLERTLPAHDRVSPGRNQRSRSMLPDGAITLLTVICSISAHRTNLCFCLLQQSSHRVAIQRIFICQERGGDTMRRGIHGDVKLTPCPSLVCAVCSYFPLSLAIDFEP